MARKHSGGFIEHDFYWNIGTGDRGRDGMNAREAAQRYNDHRHPAIELATPNDVDEWLNEVENISTHDDRPDVQGGLLVPSNARIRKPGDLMKYEGLTWMYVGDGNLYPIGVGEGCYINNAYEFVREVRYSSIPLANAISVATTDEAAQGAQSAAMTGEQIVSYLIEPHKYASARSRPLMFIRSSIRLVPTAFIDETDQTNIDILNQFPRRGRVLLLRRDLGSVDEDGVFDVSGGLLTLPIYNDDGSVPDSDILSTIHVSQAKDDSLSVVSSNPLALALDSQYFMQIHVDTHVYTDVEVSNSGYTAAQVNQVTSCTAEVESITLEVESFLGLSPFIDSSNGVRYTVSSRP